MPALYASLSVITALREANQAGSLQPTTLVSYQAEIARVFDTRDQAALSAMDMDAAALSDTTWRDQMKAAGEARTQAFAHRLMEAGYDALLVRSFAAGAGSEEMNLVLWRWNADTPASLILIDDEKRLSR